MKNDRHVEPLIKFGCEVFEAKNLKQYPKYDDLYFKLFFHLYPEENHSPRIVYDWVQGEERVAASKVPVRSIREIYFPESKS